MTDREQIESWDSAPDTRDFFISFTSADLPWALWLARIVQELGYSIWFQHQDFAGSIPRSIGYAHANSNRTILLLSDAYAKSGYCSSEWEMRYHHDPGGERDLLILFRARPCTPLPLLGRVAHVDLFACASEEAAGSTPGFTKRPMVTGISPRGMRLSNTMGTRQRPSSAT